MALEDLKDEPTARAELKARLRSAPTLEAMLCVCTQVGALEDAAISKAPTLYQQRCDVASAPFSSWYRRHRAEGAAADALAAFLAVHADATVLPSGKIRCETTGHELAPQLPALQGHWTGKAYRRHAQNKRKKT
jgi:hypothetical protein